jgi:Tfp pilus assembly protein PilV
MRKIKNSRKGLSLVEVLVATGIIAVAVYGLIVSLTMQGLAEAQSRQQQRVRNLHYQLADDILSGRISQGSLVGNLTTSGLPGTLTYSESFASPPVLATTLTWSGGGQRDYTSSIRLIYRK